MPADIFNRSTLFGDAIADHIIGWSESDNYKQSRSFPKYSITTDSDSWKPTPPGYGRIEPHWNRIELSFGIQLTSSHGRRQISSDQKSQFYNEASRPILR